MSFTFCVLGCLVLSLSLLQGTSLLCVPGTPNTVIIAHNTGSAWVPIQTSSHSMDLFWDSLYPHGGPWPWHVTIALFSAQGKEAQTNADSEICGVVRTDFQQPLRVTAYVQSSHQTPRCGRQAFWGLETPVLWALIIQPLITTSALCKRTFHFWCRELAHSSLRALPCA